MIVALVLILVLVVWCGARLSLGPLPEWFRRAFWITIMGLLVGPSFLAPHGSLVVQVIWPLAAGLALGELLAGFFRRQQAQWHARRAARQAIQDRLAQQHRDEERRARRSQRSE